MNEDQDIHSISTPLFGLLGSLGHTEFSGYHHFDMGTLFWSLTRLFGYYHRIISDLVLERDNRQFLDSNIEGFIIRMRIVLNDVAFIIRQLLPHCGTGLKVPKGKTHPRNREMSIMDIYDYLSKSQDKYPEFTTALDKNKRWIFHMREQRDNVVHYKSKVIIFETEQEISFAMLNAAGTEKSVPTATGEIRIVTTPVFEFVNGQALSLHNFLHTDLYIALKEHILKNYKSFKKIGSDERMTCIGIALFKKINNIGT
jgi:hypothetical protein